MNYQEMMKIDPNDLAGEWLDQPGRFMEVVQMVADTRAKLDRRKDELSVRESELDKRIRTDPSSYDIPKLTEGAVASAISMDSVIQQMRSNLIDIKHDLDILAGAQTALDHRRKALENLVQLQLSGLHSEPKAGRSRIVEQVGEDATSRLKNHKRQGE